MIIAIDLPQVSPPAWSIVAGAIEYMAQAKGIHVRLPHAPLFGIEAGDPKGWDGVIVRNARPDLNIPQVCVSAARAGELISVTFDENAVAKLAVDKFISMGLASLAFLGRPGRPMYDLRWDRFSRQAEDVGISPVYLTVNGLDLDETLVGLRKPCGVLAFNDEEGLRLLEDCRRLGLRVPGDLYVIGIDDTPQCLSSSPTLSSISLPFTAIGFHAARLCAQLINGEQVESIKIPPSGLILRESLAVETDNMTTAIEIGSFLRTNFSYPIQMVDIVRRSRMSRRRIEQIFQSAYGMTPMAYLKELRLERAKETLRSSDASVKDVAEKCGYTDSTQFCRTFKAQTGLTPRNYRLIQRNRN